MYTTENAVKNTEAGNAGTCDVLSNIKPVCVRPMSLGPTQPPTLGGTGNE